MRPAALSVLVPFLLSACSPPDAGDDDPASADSAAADDTDGGGGGNGGGGNGGGGNGGGGNGGGNGGQTSALVDATCTDGSIDAPMPTSDSLAAVKGAFSASAPLEFARAALDVRWPTGRVMLDGGMQQKGGGQGCFFDFTSPNERKTAAGVLGAASTYVHECGHMLDIGLSSGFKSSYQIDEDHLIDDCPGGSMDILPARSLIVGDAWSDLRAPCDGRSSTNCDFYADVYLDGNPNDGRFDSGDQGIDMLLEEVVQYVHSLAAGFAFEDQLQAGTSSTERDGILTFLWYLERYLAMLRTTAPAKYDAFVARKCWRDAILLTWGSAWAYLDATQGHPKLGIADGDLMPLVKDPELLEEIQRLRDAEGCD